MDITPITAVIGAVTGCASLIWNITSAVSFDLELYSHYLQIDFKQNSGQRLALSLAGLRKDVNGCSDDVIVLTGWFKFLLRKEGQRFKNHHVNLLDIEFNEEARKFLGKILSDAYSNVTLFPDKETGDTKLIEGSPVEINVHPNVLFLKENWRNCIDLELTELKAHLSALMNEEQYKVNIHLTTYRYPVVYEKEDGFFSRERLSKRVVSLLRRPIKM